MREKKKMKTSEAKRALAIDGVYVRENRLINHLFHSFKGEISTVIMCIEAVRDGLWGPVNANQSAWLKRALGNCDHLVQLINDYRDLTQFEEDSFPEEPDEVDIGKAIESARESVSQRAREREQELIFEIEGDLPVVVFKAPLLGRVLSNLYNLISDNTRKGGRIISELSCDSKGVALDISFEGVEIDEKLIDTVFDKYSQTEVGLQLGRGFTMLFCREAMRFLGGELTLKPWRGKGNRVEVRIPLDRVEKKTEVK